MDGSVYQFGEFRLDPRNFVLLRNGHGLRLERQPFELLTLLVSSQGRLLTRAEIAKALWGKDVFVDTEHGINTAIRKIRAALRDDPDRPRFVQTVSGMGYRFIAATEVIREEPPPPPEVPVEEASFAAQDLAPSDPALRQQGRPHKFWAGLILLATAVCAGAGLAIGRSSHEKLGTHDIAERSIRSVAVLPLANYSGDPNQDYFADGMTDELITMLARNSTLRIPSRSSVMHYKATARSLKEVADALGVDSIVEGSVSRSSNQVHMNLQLIRADTDSHLWAESYDRNAAGIAALPDEAARAIATRLHSGSATPASMRYVSPEAHDAYLRGHYLWSVGRNNEAGKAFHQAVLLQPDYALGWTGVSQYYGAGAKMGLLDPQDALPKAKAAAERAVALDSSLPQAHSILAAAIFFSNWDGEAALKEVSRATELDTRYAEAYHLQALILSAMGRYDAAIAVQEKSTAADPVTHPGAKAEILFFAHQYDRSLTEAQMRLRDFPESKDLLQTLAELDHLRGLDSQAASFLARLYSPMGDTRLNEAVVDAYKHGGYPGILRWRLAELKRQKRNGYVAPTDLAHLHAQLGDREETFTQLEQAFLLHDPTLLFIEADPAYAPFHADARYRSLLHRVNLQ